MGGRSIERRVVGRLNGGWVVDWWVGCQSVMKGLTGHHMNY